MGVGMVLTSFSGDLGFLLLSTMIMSTGFHFFYSSNSSLVLMTVGKDEAPKVLGRLQSIFSFSAVVGAIMIWIFTDGIQLGSLSIPAWGYRTILFVAGGIVAASSFFAIRNGQHYSSTRKKCKVIFRRS